MIASNSIRWLLDDCCIYEPSAEGSLKLNITELAGNLAYHAMMLEAHLTPKAGLVDCVSSGAHTDMDINTFIASSNALRPFMKEFVQVGMQQHKHSASEILPSLRQVGIRAEKAMFLATQNVNTHKGMIFTLGLICGSVGWLYATENRFNANRVREVIRACCATLVEDDLKGSKKRATTAGEKIFREHGLSGIRGEAAKGYPTIFDYGLPVYEHCMKLDCSEEQAMSRTLLSIMANNSDTNLINRGGVAGLNFVQEQSSALLDSFDCDSSDNETLIMEFDNRLIEKNLSPGGSADLLAATWLLAQLNLCSRTS
ncbi:triphosphoribosyl-dephospho-CoA synthase CitG [Vibrio sp. HN007]|uniref:triphosphoribosyl-dephospho-CoA synthase CitG n=1 Tax=Vibrio iocasae TaxID=3098914 RepID=UPI0035D4421B